MNRIALIGDNSIEYVRKLIEIWNSGYTAVLIDWRIPLLTSIEMMKDAGTESCFIESKFIKDAAIVNETGINFIKFENSNPGAQILPSDIYELYRSNYSKEDAVVIYSSGTTGKAKGIILSHEAISRNADLIIGYMSPQANDCIYICKTLSHSSTLVGELLVALKTKTRLVIVPVIVPPRLILRNINTFAVSIICVNPFLLELMINEFDKGITKVEGLKKVYVSGSSIRKSLCEEARKRLADGQVFNVYGLSEAGPRVSAQQEEFRHDNSVGKILEGISIAIVDEKGRSVAPGEKGIIHIKTPCEFSGYISGKGKNVSLYKDYLNTGDIGYIDSNGELYIVGRSDDVIMVQSHKVYPIDIEHRIMENSLVEECIVFKYLMGNKEIIACIYKGDAEEKEIRTELQKVLPLYEIPRIIRRFTELPHNLNGKISRGLAQAELAKEIEKGEGKDE